MAARSTVGGLHRGRRWVSRGDCNTGVCSRRGRAAPAPRAAPKAPWAASSWLDPQASRQDHPDRLLGAEGQAHLRMVDTGRAQHQASCRNVSAWGLSFSSLTIPSMNIVCSTIPTSNSGIRHQCCCVPRVPSRWWLALSHTLTHSHTHRYYGKMSKHDKQENAAAFSSGDRTIMVSTTAFAGNGVNIEGVKTVVMDAPMTMVSPGQIPAD